MLDITYVDNDTYNILSLSIDITIAWKEWTKLHDQYINKENEDMTIAYQGNNIYKITTLQGTEVTISETEWQELSEAYEERSRTEDGTYISYEGDEDE